MNKRLTMAALLALLAATPLRGQEEGWSLKWHGFVNPVAWWDSRQTVSGREGMMFFFPKPVELDAEGRDLNAVPSLNMLAITARINLTVTGPDVLGAKMKGFIEGDFTGSNETTINCLRLRHAYLSMRWSRGELLAGQYWYPMVMQEIMPNTQPLNMGAPFHPYARYAQTRYTHHFGPWELMATAAFQLDNKSQGPEGSSTSYLKHSSVPELNFQARYNRLADGGPFFGAAYHFSLLRPRDYTVDPDGARHLATATLPSHSFSLFGRYDFGGQWSLRTQALLNNNLYEGCTLGGYIEYAPLDGDPAAYSYRPWHFTTLWLDFSRIRGRWQPGLFAGYGFNNDFDRLGAADPASTLVFGRGADIERLFRIQPHIGFAPGHGLSFWAELEYTLARYRNSGPASNARLILSALYAF